MSILNCLSALAQQAPTSYNDKEQRLIEEAAKKTLADLEEYYNFCTNKNNAMPFEDIKALVKQKFEGEDKIFFNYFEMDDDSDPDNTKSGQSPIDVKQYLLYYRDKVKPTVQDAISLRIVNISDIYPGKALPYNFIRVLYTLKIKANSPEGKPFPEKGRQMRAVMQIIPKQPNFQVLISSINFADKPVPENEKPVPIMGRTNNDKVSSGSAMPPSYYVGQLEKGIRYTSDNNYPEAYHSLLEAKGVADEARRSDAMKKLVTKMGQANFDGSEEMYNRLISIGQNLEEKNRYKEARRYYLSAQEAMRMKSKDVGKALEGLTAKEQAEEKWTDLLEKNLYKEAKQGLESLPRSDHKNVNILIALGRAQGGLGNAKAADSAFRKALAIDASNPEIYLWQGKTLSILGNFGAASTAFVNYKTYAQEAAQPEIDKYISYAQGMVQAEKGNYQSALDSFEKSGLPQASLGIANIFTTCPSIQFRNYGRAEKILKKILEEDDRNPDAHYLQAKIILSNIDNSDVIEKKKELAIKELKTALSYNTTNAGWWLELASLQMGNRHYEDAIQSYDKHIQYNEYSEEVLPLRGWCYFLLGQNGKALSDFQSYFNRGNSSPMAYINYGRALTQAGDWGKANDQIFKGKEGDESDALLALAELYYTKSPSNESGYMDLFRQAFEAGVSQDIVNTYPCVKQLSESNRSFKKMMAKHRYTAPM